MFSLILSVFNENVHRLILQADEAELLTTMQTNSFPKGPSLRNRVSAFMKGVGSNTMDIKDIKMTSFPQSPLQSVPSSSPDSPRRLPPMLQLNTRSSANSPMTPQSVVDGPPATLASQTTLGTLGSQSTFRSKSSFRSSAGTLRLESNHSAQRLSAKEKQFTEFQDDILHRDWLPIVDKLKNAKEVSFGM